ncbi:Imm26 family immunity protein [Listeria booriae]|uniref:Imm26 family immunity protein n=1 Tax=Listeria booriae TaxID=1552123 RepID=UPI001E5E2896|nr:Imm26 family immunity protein [Listeria booriae]MCD2207903.1 immunity 26/phosphotriesterase HocA family protein [Listeria booriae]
MNIDNSKLNRDLEKVFKAGSIFQIYLSDINKFAYGLVIKKDGPFNLIAYINSFTSEALDEEKIKEYVNQKNFCMIADSGITGVVNGEWEKIAEVGNCIVSEKEIAQLEYVHARNGGVLRPNEWTYKKIIGDPMSGVMDGETINLQEAKQINNPCGSPGQGWIEGFLTYIAEGKTVVDYQMRRED